MPTAIVAPIGSGAMFTKIWQGFEQFGRLGLIGAERPRLYGGQAEGCSPVASAFADERRVSPVRPASIVSSIAIGNPADGDLAIATARTSGGAVYAVPEDEVGENIALLAETAGIFGEGATGVAIGALREMVARGDVGERDRVVVIVSGTGLKTPQLARGRPGRDRDRRRRGCAARSARGARMTGERESDPTLAEARAAIDRIDLELLAAFNRRLEIVRGLHEHKVETGLALRDPGREEAMLASLEAANAGPLSARRRRRALPLLPRP